MPRAPKPSALRALDGNAGRRPRPKGEPRPDLAPADAQPPAFLTEAARAEWHRALPQLRERGLLTEIDLNAFATYCQVYGRWQEAEREIAAGGLFVRTPRGHLVQNPHLAIANRAMKQLQRLAAEFGATPASRTKAATAPPPRRGPNPFGLL